MTADEVHRYSHLLQMRDDLELGMRTLLDMEPSTVVPLQRVIGTGFYSLPFQFEVEAGDLLAALGNRLQSVNDELEALADDLGERAA